MPKPNLPTVNAIAPTAVSGTRYITMRTTPNFAYIKSS
jgi:hypothetical protein